MKKLLVIRHAKSSWEDPYLDDHKRPLGIRGLRDSPRMGQRLKKKNVLPDLIISSDAERAKATALIIAEQIHFPKEKILFTRELYHASSSKILQLLRKIHDKYHTVFIIGHNPGFNDLISDLGVIVDNLPTSGQFAFTFDVDYWEQIDKSNAKKWFFDYPKKDF